MGMRAAWYEKQGPAREVLVVGEMPEPLPGFNEVRTGIVSTNRLLKTLPPRSVYPSRRRNPHQRVEKAHELSQSDHGHPMV